MISILVTGANGQLGSDLRAIASQYPEFRITFADRQRLDLCDIEKFEQLLDLYWPQYVINAAAYTDVEKAEHNQRAAFAVNAEALGPIGELCKKRRIKVLQISSDYVYHTESDTPITEETPLAPKGLYARSKYHGEKNLIASGASSVIIRTSWLYSSFGDNFVKTMLELSKKKKPIKVVSDQIGAPTYARDLAKAILDIVLKTEEDQIPWKGDIYNYSNTGETSWYGFAEKIFSLSKIEKVRLIPINSSEYPSNVQRPLNSRLALDKIINTWGLSIRSWEEALKAMFEDAEERENNKWRP